MNYGLVFTSWGVGGFMLAYLAGKMYLAHQTFAYAYYGASTQRAVLNFPISGQRIPRQMIRALGVNTDRATIFGLGLSNTMVALAGALIAQDQGFSDVGMGIGMIVAGLASIIIGEALIKPTTVVRLTSAAAVGSVLYRFIIALGMRLGLAPTDLKMATGLMVVIALAVPAIRGKREKKLNRWKEKKEDMDLLFLAAMENI